MKILILDTLYDSFLRTVPIGEDSYEVELRRVMSRGFGTSNFFSAGLKALGHSAVDIIVNHVGLQNRWRKDYGTRGAILEAQIEHYRPDCIISQDLSIELPRNIPLLAGQCSCRLGDQPKTQRYDLLFTSIPAHIDKLKKIGVRAVYLPLAFEPSILDRVQCAKERVWDVTFVGGVGAPSHWARGMETLEAIAREIPSFRWWGYGVETLSKNSVLREKYRGPAWGVDQYKIFMQSNIVVNRHGEVAEGFANNMRMYEATGCGAMLLTDNETDLFASDEIVRYSTPQDAVDKIRYYLDPSHEDERAEIAAKGQARTLKDHTYTKRMRVVSDALAAMLCQEVS